MNSSCFSLQNKQSTEGQGSAATLKSLPNSGDTRRHAARSSPRQRFSSPLMNIAEFTPHKPSPYLQPIPSKGSPLIHTGNSIPPPKLLAGEREPRSRRVTRSLSDKASRKELAYLVVDLTRSDPLAPELQQGEEDLTHAMAAMNTSVKGPTPKPRKRASGKSLAKASSQPPSSPTPLPRSQVPSFRPKANTVDGRHSFSLSYTPPSSPRVLTVTPSRSKSLKPPPRPPPPSKQSLRNLKSATVPGRAKTQSESSISQLKKTNSTTVVEDLHDYEEFSLEDRPLGDYEEIDKCVDVGPASTVVSSELAPPPLPPKPKTVGMFSRNTHSSPAAISDSSPVFSEEPVFEDGPESVYEPVDVSMPVPPPRMKKKSKQRAQTLRHGSFGSRKSGSTVDSSSSAAPRTDPLTRRRALTTHLSSEDISSPTLRTSTNDIAKKALEEKEEEEERRRREGEDDVGGFDDYMEMKPQQGWEEPEICPTPSDQDGPEESYVKMHPATLSGSEDEPEPEYVMMDPSVFIEPTLCYMTTDLLAQRPHLTEKR